MNEKPQTKQEPSQKTGVVKWFSKEKGYGFIHAQGEQDYYFNVKNIRGAVLPGEGEPVRFVPGKGKKGPFAKEVVLISEVTEVTEETAHAHRGVKNGRVKCPSCGQEIVPRLAFSQGEPFRSYCPICGGLISDFSKPMPVWAIVFIVTVLSFILVMFLSMLSDRHETQREFHSHFNKYDSHFR